MKTVFRYEFRVPTPESVSSLEIGECDDCYFLFSLDKDAESLGDSWGAELEDVMAQAEYMYGVKPQMWRPVTPE